MPQKFRRTHDSFYLNEKEKSFVKKYFVDIGDTISSLDSVISTENLKERLKVADIGSANGVFVNYLSQRFPAFEVVGLEYSKTLLDFARSSYPTLEFEKFDVQEENKNFKEKFDIITLCGVLSIFDDWRSIVSNILYWLKPNGVAIIQGMFNNYDVDVFIKYKLLDDNQSQLPESGWNIISEKNMTQFLSSKNVKESRFKEFEISFDLLPNLDDPIRSWTEINNDGKRSIFNGLCIRQPQKTLIIEK